VGIAGLEPSGREDIAPGRVRQLRAARNAPATSAALD
jgi:hypothetical protein